MAQISDHQHMNRLPLIVTFGGREFEIEPLGIRATNRWQARLLRAIGRLGITFGDDGKVANSDPAVLLDWMAEQAQLVLDYAEGLSPAEKEWIDRNATEEDVLAALGVIMEAANPSKPTGESLSPVGMPSTEPTPGSTSPSGPSAESG